MNKNFPDETTRHTHDPNQPGFRTNPDGSRTNPQDMHGFTTNPDGSRTDQRDIRTNPDGSITRTDRDGFHVNPTIHTNPPVPVSSEPEAVQQRADRARNAERERTVQPSTRIAALGAEAAKIRALLNQSSYTDADMKAQLQSTAALLDTLAA